MLLIFGNAFIGLGDQRRPPPLAVQEGNDSPWMFRGRAEDVKYVQKDN